AAGAFSELCCVAIEQPPAGGQVVGTLRVPLPLLPADWSIGLSPRSLTAHGVCLLLTASSSSGPNRASIARASAVPGMTGIFIWARITLNARLANLVCLESREFCMASQ